MSNKIKNIVVTALFAGFIGIFAILCVIRIFDPVKYSDVEKRPMAQFPSNITIESILNTKDEEKSTIKLFEKFTVDQFPLREFFRSLKAKYQLEILGMKENNGYTEKDGSIIEIEQTFAEENVKYTLEQLAKLYEKLANNGGNKYVSIIPDKNYFLGTEYGYPVRDYSWVINEVQAALPNMEYIDIFGELTLGDYYLTDWHWKQENLKEVLDALADGMGSADRFSGEYTENKLEGFVGGYTAMSALYPDPEVLTYLTSDILNALTVYDYETGKTHGIYNQKEFGGKEPYNFFLYGTRALLRIDNPNATTDKELILFRDSFGSSIAPLLAEGYKSIYVVDTRYIDPAFIFDAESNFYIDAEGKDVLFLYSVTILDQRILKEVK